MNTNRLLITQNILRCNASTVIVWSSSEVSIPLLPNHGDLYVHNMVQCTLYMACTYRFIWQYGKFLPTWHNLAIKLSKFMQASCSYYQLKKIKIYEILELSNNMAFILHLMKIGQLVQKFKCTHIQLWWTLYLLNLDPLKWFCYSLNNSPVILWFNPLKVIFTLWFFTYGDMKW